MKLIAKSFSSVCGALLWACSAQAIDGKFTAVETWTLTLEFEDFQIHGRQGGYTAVKTYSGTERGTLEIRNGEYTLINHTGLRIVRGDSLTSRSIEEFGDYTIYGSYAFGPGYGVRAYGVGFLGAFVVKVPFFNGEVPAFYDFETYEAFGSSLSALQGGGYMVSDHLTATVSSRLSLVPVGPVSMEPPGILVQPRDVLVDYGRAARLSVRTKGAALNFQWYFNGQPLDDYSGIYDIDGAALIIRNVTRDTAGAYQVVVENSFGSVTSDPVTVAARPPIAPAFVGLLRDRTVREGGPLKLSVRAKGSAPIRYQWFQNGFEVQSSDDVPDALGRFYKVFEATSDDEGSYFVIASNDGGSVTSRVATVTLKMPAR